MEMEEVWTKQNENGDVRYQERAAWSSSERQAPLSRSQSSRGPPDHTSQRSKNEGFDMGTDMKGIYLRPYS